MDEGEGFLHMVVSCDFKLGIVALWLVEVVFYRPVDWLL